MEKEKVMSYPEHPQATAALVAAMAEIKQLEADRNFMREKMTTLRYELREANGKLAEYDHAVDHLFECSTTNLCKDCTRLMKAARAHKHWIHYTDD